MPHRTDIAIASLAVMIGVGSDVAAAATHAASGGPGVPDDATIAAVTEQLARNLLADVASELAT